MELSLEEFASQNIYGVGSRRCRVCDLDSALLEQVNQGYNKGIPIAKMYYWLKERGADIPTRGPLYTHFSGKHHLRA